jgi:hypothetical protein
MIASAMVGAIRGCHAASAHVPRWVCLSRYFLGMGWVPITTWTSYRFSKKRLEGINMGTGGIAHHHTGGPMDYCRAVFNHQMMMPILVVGFIWTPSYTGGL